ncbi:MAG: hypothetical protein AAGD10_21615 [Myxococcota bacterium]
MPFDSAENLELFPPPRAPITVRSGPSARRIEHSAPARLEKRERPSAPARFFDAPSRDFEWAGGVHLSDSVLWCDADRKKELSFVSSAHADVVGKKRRILATDETVRILTRGSGRIDALTSPFRRPFVLGNLELEMHPSGRMLGAAQLLVRREKRRLLYTNDFLTQKLATAERAQPVPCDVIAMPGTFGRRDCRFPERAEVFERILSFVDDTLEEKANPVLVVPPLGPAQELMYMLGKRGYRLRVHRGIHDIAKVYIQLGRDLLGARRLQGQPARDEIVLIPPILRHDATVRAMPKRRLALISGRALDQAYVYQTGVDEAFPLAEAADHQELLDFVAACGAREIYLTTQADELAEDLRQRGLKVHDLVKPEQLSLF